MQSPVRRLQNNVYHRSDGAALLIASDGQRAQQTVVHVLITPQWNQVNISVNAQTSIPHLCLRPTLYHWLVAEN